MSSLALKHFQRERRVNVNLAYVHNLKYTEASHLQKMHPQPSLAQDRGGTPLTARGEYWLVVCEEHFGSLRRGPTGVRGEEGRGAVPTSAEKEAAVGRGRQPCLPSEASFRWVPELFSRCEASLFKSFSPAVVPGNTHSFVSGYSLHTGQVHPAF